MKTLTKNIWKLFAVILLTVFGFNANAQTHNKAAANCVYHVEFVKNKTKKVSAVDGFCKICGNKKEEERKKKLAAEKTASEQKQKVETVKQKQEYAKGLAEQKKKAEAEKQKAKDNEAILVAPTPKVKVAENKPIAENKKAQAKSGYNPDLEAFSDYDKREIGLKLNGKIIFSKSKENSDDNIERIKETNFFVINTINYNDDRKSYSQIIDMSGNVLNVGGFDKFHYLKNSPVKAKYEADNFELIVIQEPSFIIGRTSRGNVSRSLRSADMKKEWFSSVSEVVDTFLSADTTGGIVNYVFTTKSTILKVDRNLKILEKKDGVAYALVANRAVTDEDRKKY